MILSGKEKTLIRREIMKLQHRQRDLRNTYIDCEIKIRALRYKLNE